MRKLKRIAAVLLAGVMALSMLSGCALSGYTQSGKDEFGEYLMNGVRIYMSDACLDGKKYENDSDLEQELQKWIKESVDPETNEIKSDVHGKNVYTPNQENPTKISYYGIIEDYKADAQDFNEYKTEGGLPSAIGHVTQVSAGEYKYIPSVLNAELTKFAVTYQVLTDKEGNEHLYFACGLVMTPKAES